MLLLPLLVLSTVQAGLVVLEVPDVAGRDILGAVGVCPFLRRQAALYGSYGFVQAADNYSYSLQSDLDDGRPFCSDHTDEASDHGYWDVGWEDSEAIDGLLSNDRLAEGVLTLRSASRLQRSVLVPLLSRESNPRLRWYKRRAFRRTLWRRCLQRLDRQLRYWTERRSDVVFVLRTKHPHEVNAWVMWQAEARPVTKYPSRVLVKGPVFEDHVRLQHDSRLPKGYRWPIDGWGMQALPISAVSDKEFGCLVALWRCVLAQDSSQMPASMCAGLPRPAVEALQGDGLNACLSATSRRSTPADDYFESGRMARMRSGLFRFLMGAVLLYANPQAFMVATIPQALIPTLSILLAVLACIRERRVWHAWSSLILPVMASLGESGRLKTMAVAWNVVLMVLVLVYRLSKPTTHTALLPVYMLASQIIIEPRGPYAPFYHGLCTVGVLIIASLLPSPTHTARLQSALYLALAPFHTSPHGLLLWAAFNVHSFLTHFSTDTRPRKLLRALVLTQVPNGESLVMVAALSDRQPWIPMALALRQESLKPVVSYLAAELILRIFKANDASPARENDLCRHVPCNLYLSIEK